MKLLVTGGAGFIGTNFLNLYVPKYPDYTFINFDKLTYAANPLNLQGIEGASNYYFELGDIAEHYRVEAVFKKYCPDVVVHFAAESHVDRSILGPEAFIHTNIKGTFNLLEICRKYWKDNKEQRFHHISTDEVFGTLGETGRFREDSRYDPSSPYAASKAASDHLVRSYYRTYGLPVTISHSSNNYGPYQFPEKLIPLIISKALNGLPLPVYGNGENIRDWLYVEDHCEAIWLVLQGGKVGETYNIGGNCERKNINVVMEICDKLAVFFGKPPRYYRELISYVQDRPGHDFRYAIDPSKITNELNWKPNETFETGLEKTIQWYLHNMDWLSSKQTNRVKDN